MCTYIVQYIVQDKCCKQILFELLVFKDHVVRTYPVSWDAEEEIVPLCWKATWSGHIRSRGIRKRKLSPCVERPRGQGISGPVGYGKGNCFLVLKGHVVRDISGPVRYGNGNCFLVLNWPRGQDISSPVGYGNRNSFLVLNWPCGQDISGPVGYGNRKSFLVLNWPRGQDISGPVRYGNRNSFLVSNWPRGQDISGPVGYGNRNSFLVLNWPRGQDLSGPVGCGNGKAGCLPLRYHLTSGENNIYPQLFQIFFFPLQKRQGKRPNRTEIWFNFFLLLCQQFFIVNFPPLCGNLIFWRIWLHSGFYLFRGLLFLKHCYSFAS